MNFSGLVADDNAERTLNLSYQEFVMPLINSVQELNKRNQELQQKNSELEKKLVQNTEQNKAAYDELKAELELLKRSLINQ